MPEQGNEKTNYTPIMLIIGALVILAALVWAFMGTKNTNTGQPLASWQQKEAKPAAPDVELSTEASIKQLIPKLRMYGLDEIAPQWRGRRRGVRPAT